AAVTMDGVRQREGGRRAVDADEVTRAETDLGALWKRRQNGVAPRERELVTRGKGRRGRRSGRRCVRLGAGRLEGGRRGGGGREGPAAWKRAAGAGGGGASGSGGGGGGVGGAARTPPSAARAPSAGRVAFELGPAGSSSPVTGVAV